MEGTRDGHDDRSSVRMGGGGIVKVYLTTEQAAEILGVSPCTLADWRWKRKGPPWVPLSRKCVRYEQAALEKWMESRTVHELLD